MANFGLLEKPYIKIGTQADMCYVCYKDACVSNIGTNKDAYDIKADLTGSLEDKIVFYMRQSGNDTCICLDCFKKLYNEIVVPELPKETVVEEAAKEVVAEEKKTASTKKAK